MRDLWREVCDWWQRRYHPHKVAGANVTVLDEETWANPLSTGQLHRRWRRYERLKDKGKLRGEHLVRAIATRKVLMRRIRSEEANEAYVNKTKETK